MDLGAPGGPPQGGAGVSANTAMFVMPSTSISSPTPTISVSTEVTKGLTRIEQTGIGVGTIFVAVAAIGLGLLLWTRCGKASVSSKDDAIGQHTGLLAGGRSHARVTTSFSAWLWEFMALLVGMAAFVAIVIILKVNDHQELSAWTLPISLNTIVSFWQRSSKAF